MIIMIDIELTESFRRIGALSLKILFGSSLGRRRVTQSPRRRAIIHPNGSQFVTRLS